MSMQGMGQSCVAEKPTRQRIIIVSVLCIGIVVSFMDRVNVSVLAVNEPFLLAMGIKGQAVQIGMLMSSFLLVYGVSNLLLSPIGDYFGPRKTMFFCFVLMGVSLFIGGIATSFTVMIASRILLGLAEGCYYPNHSAFVKNWFPPNERGRANAAWSVGQSLAPAVAMPLFAYCIATFSWHFSFFICVALGLIPMYLLWFHTTDRPREHKKVNALELQYIEEGLAKEAGAGHEYDAQEPFWQRIRPFATNYAYWLVVVCWLSLNTVYWGLISWIPAYLKVARGFSWIEMGWLASLPYIVGVFNKGLSGWLVDRLGRCAWVIFASLFLSSICLYFTVTVSDRYVAALFLSLALGSTQLSTPAVYKLFQGMIPAKSLSTAAGVLTGVGAILSSSSPLVIGFFINLTGGYDGGLLFLVGTGLFASLLAGFLAVKKY